MGKTPVYQYTKDILLAIQTLVWMMLTENSMGYNICQIHQSFPAKILGYIVAMLLSVVVR